ncbi:NMDA receptor synaptonuclear signaling and neuronal migration factor-like [Halichondria panicea]|uniref:NMDA receptor synaptonuclear signaling and neuronal migration factor-like n=1 Tax=Halichondria panicea TaxID=6063 RepID=UPI00312B82E6
MDDIDRARFYTAQQVEAGLPNYQPQRIVLISSNIPKAQRLRKAVRDDVLATVYDFSSDLGQVLEAVRELLEGVTAGAKAKHIAIVTKGGPGYVYLVRKTPLTPAKLKRNQAMLKFWRGLGGQMSKLFPGQSTIHFMESNMGGNKQGEKLLMDLESVLYAHQVQFSCPLEMAAKGRAMINMYFNPVKHKLWKSARYTKLRLY